jgi:hypothetical protein
MGGLLSGLGRGVVFGGDGDHLGHQVIGLLFVTDTDLFACLELVRGDGF